MLLVLQWGRRANATESAASPKPVRKGGEASMGPPRERDGESKPKPLAAREELLQWGRRATATQSSPARCCSSPRTALQWGRRANATERPCPPPEICRGSELQWGRRANATERRTRKRRKSRTRSSDAAA